MALTFPRDLPAVRWLEQPSFDLAPAVAINRAGGSLQAMELADPLWTARFVSEPLTWQGRALLRAWAASLRGGTRTFYGTDPFAKWPFAYGKAVLGLTRAGGGAFDGTAKLTANGTTTIGLGTLPSSYEVRAGDMIELPRAGGLISLHMAAEDVSANGLGAVTVTVEPPVLGDATINSTAVRLVAARCIMVIKPGTFSAPAGIGKRSAEFEAVQTLQ